MTGPDHSGVDAAVAAYEQAVDAGAATQSAELAQVQAALDAETAKDTADEATIASLTATVAQLQAQIPAQAAGPLFGANLQGWASQGESTAAAQPRIISAFGNVPVVRDWPGSTTFTWDQRTAKYPVGTSLIVEFAAADVRNLTAADLANWQRLCQSCPTDRPMWLTADHEPEGKTRTTVNQPAAYQAGMAKLGAIHRQYSPPNLRFALVLEGSTFLPDRYTWGGNSYTAAQWLPAADFYDDVGADVYQQMMGAKAVDTGTADTAAYVLGPVFALAKTLGKGTVFPEFAVFSVDAYHALNSACVGQPDAARAKVLTDCIGLFRANQARAVCYFEATEGGSANPSCLTAPPGWGQSAYSPAALAAWRTAAMG